MAYGARSLIVVAAECPGYRNAVERHAALLWLAAACIVRCRSDALRCSCSTCSWCLTPQEADKRLAAESVALIAQECDSQTFLRSWSPWGALLTGMVQMDGSALIRAAAWAAMSCVIARHALLHCWGLTELCIFFRTPRYRRTIARW
jgi:hypothetical protein